MRLLTSPKISNNDQCPYISDELERHEFFFADSISRDEMDFLLSKGWRKFGQFLFRPRCESCQKCIPLRVNLDKFKPSKSQRRVLNTNSDLTIKFKNLVYNSIHFELYRKHSEVRFDEKSIEVEEDFIQTFYMASNPQMLTEIYEGSKLLAFGILDIGEIATSSVYFVFDPDYSKRSLGNLGALKEMQFAQELGHKYYYLGYWISENKSMQYKNNFKPNELYDWETKLWTIQDSEK